MIYFNNHAYTGQNYHILQKNNKDNRYSPLKQLDRSADHMTINNKARFMYNTPTNYNPKTGNNININGVKY